MSTASLSEQTATAKPASSREKSKLMSAGIVVILVLVAIYALAVHHGASANELVLMGQFP